MIGRFLRGPWTLAIMIALPLAELYMVGWIIYDISRGSSEVWLDIMFGWLIALVAAAIIAVPLGILFMGLNALWQATRWWWGKLPFAVVRKRE